MQRAGRRKPEACKHRQLAPAPSESAAASACPIDHTESISLPAPAKLTRRCTPRYTDKCVLKMAQRSSDGEVDTGGPVRHRSGLGRVSGARNGAAHARKTRRTDAQTQKRVSDARLIGSRRDTHWAEADTATLRQRGARAGARGGRGDRAGGEVFQSAASSRPSLGGWASVAEKRRPTPPDEPIYTVP
ncbi:unnamed protein product [Leptosia nina]|uniref:Uncharacterized protein n=1 Tax=Leptosia nina TaxID=320188 RepID=A0AAV1JZT6_9NEOP